MAIKVLKKPLNCLSACPSQQMPIFKEPKEPPRVSSIRFLLGTGALCSLIHPCSTAAAAKGSQLDTQPVPELPGRDRGQELPTPSARTQTQIKAPGAQPPQQSYFPLCFCIGCWCPGACPEQQLGWHCHMSGERGLEEHCASCLGGKEFQKIAEVWRLPGIWDWTEKSRTEIKRKSHQVTKEVQHYHWEV